jgi:hypothetical protein
MNEGSRVRWWLVDKHGYRGNPMRVQDRTYRKFVDLDHAEALKMNAEQGKR